MIFAPSGAHSLGHVGWAFLVNQGSGSWYYGANEGSVSGPGTASKTWFTNGTWADLLDAFSGEYPGKAIDPSHPSYFHKAGYYQTYRCESIVLNDSSSAQSVVSGEQGADYTIPLNDCLSNAVSVLQAYGVTGLPSDVARPVPRNYYANLPDFEAALPLPA